jgi:hypothetical protein
VADYLRQHVSLDQIRKNFDKALDLSLRRAHDQDALSAGLVRRDRGQAATGAGDPTFDEEGSMTTTQTRPEAGPQRAEHFAASMRPRLRRRGALASTRWPACRSPVC